ncbi:MAG: HNH endonuclease [Thainema sp.]
MSISATLRAQMQAQADYRCEYCKTSSRLVGMPLVIDHIQPQAEGGSDNPDNLAAACYRCNEFKGAKTFSVDPATNQLAKLFNPRTQQWSDHFAWINGGTHIAGNTQSGRATVIALRLNNDQIVSARTLWITVGWHPPS